MDRLLAGQKDTAFVKVQPGEVNLLENALDAMEEEARLSATSDPAPANMLGWEVTYNLYERGADICTKRGGSVTAVSGWKLPIFKKIRFSAVRVELEVGRGGAQREGLCFHAGGVVEECSCYLPMLYGLPWLTMVSLTMGMIVVG